MDCATFVEMPLNRRHVQEKASEPKQAVVVAQSPHSLIARAQTGDLQAFNQLVEDKQALAYNMARRILQSQEAAADAVQESLIKARPPSWPRASPARCRSASPSRPAVRRRSGLSR